MKEAIVIICIDVVAGLVFGLWVCWMILPNHIDKWHPKNPFKK